MISFRKRQGYPCVNAQQNNKYGLHGVYNEYKIEGVCIRYAIKYQHRLHGSSTHVSFVRHRTVFHTYYFHTHSAIGILQHLQRWQVHTVFFHTVYCIVCLSNIYYVSHSILKETYCGCTAEAWIS